MKKILRSICAILCSLSIFAGNLAGTATPIYADTNSAFEIDKDHVLTKYTGIGGDITIPKGVKTIGYKAFAGCSNLQSVKMPDSVTSIEESAFDSCAGLKEVQLSSKLKSIKASAFWGCGNLTKISIPKSVQEIGTTAFTNCEDLHGLYIPKSVKAIGNYAIGFLYYGDYVLTSNAVILGERNSEAMNYATKYNISFLTKANLKCKLTSVKAKNAKQILVKWNKNSSVNGYQIQYATNKKSLASAKTIKVSKNSYKISSVKKNKTYYVRIRGYRKIGGYTYYSNWSSCKSVRVR